MKWVIKIPNTPLVLKYFNSTGYLFSVDETDALIFTSYGVAHEVAKQIKGKAVARYKGTQTKKEIENDRTDN